MKTISKFTLLLTVALLVSTSTLFASEYHVSLNGSDTQGDGSISNPWRHPEYGAKQLQAGDTLYIHEGTYLISPNNSPETSPERHKPMISPWAGTQGSASSPITITSYQDDHVFLDGGTTPPYPVIGAAGSGGGSYVIIDGFTIRGAATLMWVDNSIIQNCDISGGLDCPQGNGGDAFGNVVRVEGGDGNIIRHNKLHDNQIGITRGNSPLLMEYDCSNLTIENNEIYNSVAAGIYLKDNPENVTIRYNHIYNNYYAGVQGANQDQGHDIKIYQNILKRNNTSNDPDRGAIHIHVYIDGLKIYNNTFIDSGVADIRAVWGTGVADIQVWNNIFISSNKHYDLGSYGSGNNFSDDWTYSNFNNFSNGSWHDRSSTWDTLTAYQNGNSKNFDRDSHTNDPLFVNPTGDSPEDYKRTSYPSDGRGGAYAPVIGAYITGNETIGYSDDGGGGQTSPAPSAPSNFTIIN